MNQTTPFSDITTDGRAESDFITIKCECVKIWDDYENRLSQLGLFIDLNGDKLKIACWEQTGRDIFKSNTKYVIKDVQLLPESSISGIYCYVHEKTTFTRIDSLDNPRALIQFCETCNTKLEPENYKKGPEAPSIGWEYYLCPKCGNKGRQTGEVLS